MFDRQTRGLPQIYAICLFRIDSESPYRTSAVNSPLPLTENTSRVTG